MCQNEQEKIRKIPHDFVLHASPKKSSVILSRVNIYEDDFFPLT